MRSTVDETTGHETREADPACVALVPLTPSAGRTRIVRQMTRPDPTFVTHLIATAAHEPQTRNLRRAAASDALSAYTARPRPPASTGGRTRQVI